MKPLDADLDQRMADAIKARGPVGREVLDREFDRCSLWLLALAAVALLVIFLL